MLRWPARLAYQVCECTSSTPSQAAVIAVSAEMTCRAGFAGGEPAVLLRDGDRALALGAGADDGEVETLA